MAERQQYALVLRTSLPHFFQRLASTLISGGPHKYSAGHTNKGRSTQARRGVGPASALLGRTLQAAFGSLRASPTRKTNYRDAGTVSGVYASIRFSQQVSLDHLVLE